MRTPAALPRFLVVVILLLSTALFLQARRRAEMIPKAPPLDSFPKQVGRWQGRDIPISADVREMLGPGDFLSRLYLRPDLPFIDFFVAYFPSQRTGSSIHSPKNCLPGSGWTPLASSVIQLAVPGHAAVTANRYIIARGEERQLVLYWYQAHGRTVASEYWAKIYLVADAMRMNRTDGALIRLVTPLQPGESVAQAQDRLAAFARPAVIHLDHFLPQ